MSRAPAGLAAPQVRVEVHLGAGLPAFIFVGLPETVVRVSKERVRSAILNSGFKFPDGRITVNLAPADLPKEGGRFDLPIALGILAAGKQISADVLEQREFYGELSLTGELRETPRLLPSLITGVRQGRDLIIPAANIAEGSLISCARIRLADTLSQVCSTLRDGVPLPCAPPPTPPFRRPQHTASAASLIGGGMHLRPGELALAHHGVPFLDELPEFSRDALESLREPLESGVVVLSRAKRVTEYPAQFQLIAAMNPCPCGYQGDARRRCHCSGEQVRRYRGKLSGPLIDRIDIHLEIQAVPSEHLTQPSQIPSESSAEVARRCADLAAVERIATTHVSEAIALRALDRAQAEN